MKCAQSFHLQKNVTCFGYLELPLMRDPGENWGTVPGVALQKSPHNSLLPKMYNTCSRQLTSSGKSLVCSKARNPLTRSLCQHTLWVCVRPLSRCVMYTHSHKPRHTHQGSWGYWIMWSSFCGSFPSLKHGRWSAFCKKEADHLPCILHLIACARSTWSQSETGLEIRTPIHGGICTGKVGLII